MSAIKNFFTKRKLDRRFKQAGEGHKLSDPDASTRPAGGRRSESQGKERERSESTSRSAEAALARIATSSQAKPNRPVSSKATWKNPMQVSADVKGGRKEPKSSTATAMKLNLNEYSEELESAPMLSSILFACPLCPACLPENEIRNHIEECLYKDIPSEPAMVAATMIHTLNDTQKVRCCIEVLNKYLDNIIKNPSEEKYRKIRINNKVFAKVKDLKGVKELLTLAIGFIQAKLPLNEEEKEDFFLLSEGLAMETERLEIIKGYINEAEPLLPILDRNVRVYKPGPFVASLELPSDFYTVSNQEVKREQQERAKSIEKNKELSTKAMKEKESQSQKRFYRFTLIRIRFPDGHLLEGTFFSKDEFKEVTSFVKESLEIDWLPFELSDGTGKKFNASETTLEALGIAPAAILNFQWDQSVAEDVRASDLPLKKYLRSEFLARLVEL